MTKNEIFPKMTEAIVAGDRKAARALAEEAVRSGLDLPEVVEKGYVPGLQKVGELWEQGEYFLPELITSAEAMKAAMAVLEPELNRKGVGARMGGKIVIGTVEGDIHDIGKNLVASMLQAGGFEVFDLGADVKLEKFIETAEAVGRRHDLPVRPADDDHGRPAAVHRPASRQGPSGQVQGPRRRRPGQRASGPRRSARTATPRTPSPPSSWPSPWPGVPETARPARRQ